MTVASVSPAAPRVAIAGASGFIGHAVVTALADDHALIALARNAEGNPAHENVEWRACDLFNLRDAERALAGADVALYLVHSMMPSSRLTQASFEDLDLICADNFARAARANGVKLIVYLGGLMPASRENLSPHLRSRLEVEKTLAAYEIPLTTLRAGVVIGAGGSSFDMMARLVERLPFMIGPRWTRSLSQAIALADAVSLLCYAVDHPELAGTAYDVGGPDVVSYADMMRLTGAVQGKRTRVLTLPIPTVNLSLLWVSIITGASQELVRPLIASLKHDMVATDGLVLQQRAGIVPIPLRDALTRALAEERKAKTESPNSPHKKHGQKDRRACSIQRLPIGQQPDAIHVAHEYMRWLPRFMRPVLRVEVDEAGNCRFLVPLFRTPLLTLTYAPERSSPDRQLFFVTEGLLSGEPGTKRPRLEFRRVLGGTFVLAAIFDFVPRLPWQLYKYTQAMVHLWVMRNFGAHLGREASGDRAATQR